ncbi:hypothetical protein PVK06_019071 [Gossypium arboreum]|uniref:CCHC-type domain-containing protein n=1 Tax=Gossypium arboreum TaxID=29729 RepID=A0ABR0PIQ0_GOSAR|nr:hypothetical protein PVK06_019071 [Gossypium arboreum]
MMVGFASVLAVSVNRTVPTVRSDNDLELLEEDVNTTTIDGVLAITFLERLKNILFREMELTVIVKLLGHNIGYNALHNRILSLWKPVNSIRLIDTTNGYFFVKFQAVEDYNRVLSQEAIGRLIGKVVKLDVQTDNQTRGRFARLVVYINLEKPLISYVNGAVQCIEYEALSTICFACGKYGHVKDMCPTVETEQNPTVTNGKSSIEVDKSNEGKSDGNSTESRSKEKEPEFGPWMLVERQHSRRGKKDYMAEGENGNKKVAARLNGFKARVNKNVGVFLDKAGDESGEDLGLPSGSNMKEGMGSEKLEEMGRMPQVNLDKALGKRPMGSRFKTSENTRIPLAESIKTMAELLSPQILSKNSNAEIDAVGSNLKCSNGLEN